MYDAVNNLVGSTQEFQLYVYGLGIAGLISIIMAIVGFGASTGARILTGLVGLGAVAYGVWLAFIDTSTTFNAYFYFLIVPVLAIINAIRSRRPKSEQPPAA